MISMAALFVLMFITPVLAKDYGTHGALYPIAEPDLLKAMERRARFLKPALKMQPQPLKAITKATKSRCFEIDPSITLNHDLRDHKGRVFYKKGTTFNPLKHRSLPAPLVFIDGHDKKQLAHAQSLKGAKIILVAGDPFLLMKDLKRSIFFDQGGVLTSKLNIRHVPAVVRQKGLKLRVCEEAL